MRFALKTAAALLLLWMFLLSDAGTQNRKPEAVSRDTAISVNGVKISESEVQQAIDSQMASGVFHLGASQSQKKREQFRKLVIERLIESELLYQEAKRLGIRVEKAEVEDVISRETAAYRSKGDFYKSLEARGFDKKAYERIIEKDLMTKKVMRQEVEDKVNISDKDIKK